MIERGRRYATNTPVSATFLVTSAILAIAVDVGLVRLGYGLALPAIRLELPGSYATYGAVGTAHFVGYLLGTLLAPIVLRRDIGGRRTAVGSHALVAVFLFASAFVQSLFAFGLLRALMGVACGLGVASAVTGTLERTSVARRSAVSGFVWGGVALGLVLSALAAPAILTHPDDWRTAIVVAGAIALLAALTLGIAFAPGFPAAAPVREVPFRLADLLDPRRYLFLSAAYFCFGVAYTAFATFFVAALRSVHATPIAIGIVWAAFGLAALIGGLFVGQIMARRRDALSIALGCAAAGAAVASFSGIFAAIAGTLAVGLGFASAPAIATALARSRSSAGTSAAAFVAITAVVGVGQIAGPAVAGALADHFSPNSVTMFSASVYALGAALAFIDAKVATAPA